MKPSKDRPFVTEHEAMMFLLWVVHTPQVLEWTPPFVQQANDLAEAYPSAYIAWKAKQRLGVE